MKTRSAAVSLLAAAVVLVGPGSAQARFGARAGHGGGFHGFSNVGGSGPRAAGHGYSAPGHWGYGGGYRGFFAGRGVYRPYFVRGGYVPYAAPYLAMATPVPVGAPVYVMPPPPPEPRYVEQGPRPEVQAPAPAPVEENHFGVGTNAQGYARGQGVGLGVSLFAEGKRWGVNLSGQGILVRSQACDSTCGSGTDKLQVFDAHLTYALIASEHLRLRLEGGVSSALAPDLAVLGPDAGVSLQLKASRVFGVEGAAYATVWPYRRLDARAYAFLGLGALQLQAGWREIRLDDRGLVDGVAHADRFTGPYAGLALVF